LASYKLVKEIFFFVILLENITKKCLKIKQLHSEPERKLLSGNPHKKACRTFAKNND